jgi:cold shock CspA family protein/ribosome-associated translation inhibitor RaiA
METPMEIVFQGMGSSFAIEERIRKEAEKLERYHDRITACRVVIEAPHRRHEKGNLFNVRIELTVPGRPQIVVSRSPADHQAHEEPYVALRDAFDAARRRLQDIARRQRGDVKTHEAPPQGRIIKLMREQGYGFIEREDGVEVYFHRNSVVDGRFDQLKVGDIVRFAAEQGEKGVQASTVHAKSGSY